MSELDRGVALHSTGEGRYDVDVSADWFAQAGPNGGYLAALLTRAVEAAVAAPLRSLTVHYLRPAVAGPAQVEVTITRAGRSLTFAEAHLTQDGSPVAHAMAALGAGRGAAPYQDVAPPPDLPRAEDLPPPPPPPPGMPWAAIADRLDYRPVGTAPLFSGAPGDFWCWLRLADPAPLDAAALALLTDAMIPAVFLRATALLVAPTVDLTVHFRSQPAPSYDGWCLGHVRTTTTAEGFAEEDCEIYDDAGVLLAQSRQLSLIIPFG